MRFVNGVRTRTGLMGIDYPTASWLYRSVHYAFECCKVDPNMGVHFPNSRVLFSPLHFNFFFSFYFLVMSLCYACTKILTDNAFFLPIEKLDVRSTK